MGPDLKSKPAGSLRSTRSVSRSLSLRNSIATTTTTNTTTSTHSPSRVPSTVDENSGTGTGITSTGSSGAFMAMRYEDARPAKPPIPVTVAPPRAPPTDTHPAFRNRDDTLHHDPAKRDSGLAPTTTSSNKAREGSVTTVDEEKDASASTVVLGVSFNFDPPPPEQEQPQRSANHTAMASTPPTTADTTNGDARSGGHTNERTMSKLRKARPRREKDEVPRTPTGQQGSASDEDFSPITTAIPTEELLEEDFMAQLSFSKRGSVMLSGKKAVVDAADGRTNGTGRPPPFSFLVSPSSKPVLSGHVELESQKVRSMYESGSGYDLSDGRTSAMSNRPTLDESVVEDTSEISDGLLNPHGLHRPETAFSTRSEGAIRREHELAGGIEDWEDVNGKDVDRYGFINKPKDNSRSGSPEPRGPQRVTTMLQLASEAPRKTRTFGRSASTATSSYKHAPNRKLSAKSLRTQNTQTSTGSRRSGMRAAANRLPGNRDRRWMDEAGDMLTLPPGLADIAEDQEGGRAAEGLKKKEWDRSEKWRKMAKVVKAGNEDGQGMEFEFDPRNPKVIERTWKGIPDRWRAAAWHSFLSASAKKVKDSPIDEDIVEAFHRLQDESSADDVQIDIDVPRTINRHIMFRRRYRGGQRLLFRTLHALSLYFPKTGYVQGMASLAATLLCYYDEEKTFIMLVRMWRLRGLEKLYESGFPGLMAALDEFQKDWLDGSDVAKKLDELNIDPTAYGTRWYLTLFNYSIPFPAQLRVWDVFMLLGDADTSSPPTKERPFSGGLDVLHATSAALIDGTREILLDSDFENVMKVLTSWIPVKDEELLMKVTKAEWKLHRGKRRPT